MPLIRPGGLLKPNARAKAKGLSFAVDFGNGGADWYTGRDTVVGAYLIGLTRTTIAGDGMMGNGSNWYSSNAGGNTWAPSTVAGTIIFGLVADRAAASMGETIFAQIGNYEANPRIFFNLWGGPVLECGWLTASGDLRVKLNPTGLWAAGDAFTLALSWDSSAGQRLYVKGLEVGSNGSTGFAAPTAPAIAIGALNGGAYAWSTSDAGGVLFCLAFDRVLTPDEIAAAEQDFWWWARQSRPAVGAGSSVTFLDVVAGGQSFSLGSATQSALATLFSIAASNSAGISSLLAIGNVAAAAQSSGSGAAHAFGLSAIASLAPSASQGLEGAQTASAVASVGASNSAGNASATAIGLVSAAGSSSSAGGMDVLALANLAVDGRSNSSGAGATAGASAIASLATSMSAGLSAPEMGGFISAAAGGFSAGWGAGSPSLRADVAALGQSSSSGQETFAGLLTASVGGFSATRAGATPAAGSSVALLGSGFSMSWGAGNASVSGAALPPGSRIYYVASAPRDYTLLEVQRVYVVARARRVVIVPGQE